MLAPHAPARVTPRSQPAAMKLRSPAIRPRRRHYPSVAPAPGARRTKTSSPSVRTPNTATGRVACGEQHPAGREVKAGAVQPALDRAVRHLALRQRHRLVGALVPQRVQRAAGPDEAHRALADIHVHRAALADLGQAARPHPAARVPRRAHRPRSRAASAARPVPVRSRSNCGSPGRRSMIAGCAAMVSLEASWDATVKSQLLPGRPGFLSVADRSIYTSSPVKTLPSSSPAPYPAPIPGGRTLLSVPAPVHHAR